MSDAAVKLLEQIRALPDADRQFIADELACEGYDETAFVNELHGDPEFMAMLDDRMRQAEEHPESLLDGDTVMAELRERFARGGK